MPKPMVDNTLRCPQEEHSTFSESEICVVKTLVGYTFADVERELIRETLVAHRGNRTRSAEILSVSVRTLRNKIRAHKAGGLTICEASPPSACKDVRRRAPLSPSVLRPDRGS
jgi:DNA-binding NtrC family response regulator